MIETKVHIDKQLRAALDPDRVVKSFSNKLELFMGHVARTASEATPVGVFGALAGSWLDSYGVKRVNNDIVGYTQVTRDSVKQRNPQARSNYLYYVLHGTGPASKNPGRYLVRWVEKKLGLTGKEAVSVAFAIGTKRMREGSKGNDFLTPIRKKLKNQLRALMREDIIDVR